MASLLMGGYIMRSLGGDYHKLFKVTDRQIAIHEAVGGLLVALRMEGK
ncbi:hypothetical protein Barba10S_gp064 [Rheinheimera phage vB_RspM_Barba10S]|uniref:Uncharacterized protein n=1 Tax=Rheinheimera phage vB_RspM_Barba10S TaxID=2565645 RepID=A0A4P8N0U0_9CAUD|nr:hypothetical protein Barba10S_gp064 [Rheinheimera phage vB_RspM_Barba10S]